MSDEKTCPTCGRCPTCGHKAEPKPTYPAVPMTYPVIMPVFVPYQAHPVELPSGPWPLKITCCGGGITLS